MPSTTSEDLLEVIRRSGKLSQDALRNLEAWLQDSSLADSTDEIQSLVSRLAWPELEDAFYKHITIGTGGLRGAIGPGPNRINTRTIGEAAQALCQFIQARGPDAVRGGVVVGHEARLGSLEFATVCCEVFAANGIRAYLFDGVRSTPEVSFAVRHLHATAGQDGQRLQILLVIRRAGSATARPGVHAARHRSDRDPPLTTGLRR
jgi:hypothetical protein